MSRAIVLSHAALMDKCFLCEISHSLVFIVRETAEQGSLPPRGCEVRPNRSGVMLRQDLSSFGTRLNPVEKRLHNFDFAVFAQGDLNIPVDREGVVHT